MSVLKINGTTLKTPNKYSVELADLDGDAKRNAKGAMRRDRVRGADSVLRSVTCEWGMMNDSEMKPLLQAMKAASFTLTYPDPYTGADRTGSFYVGNRSCEAYSWNSKYKKWRSMKCTFVEM